MSVPFLTICPAFPGPSRANDGQSLYVVETLKALSQRTGRRLKVLALRLGDEPAHEQGDFFEVERVEPAVPVPDVFSLYEARCFPSALRPLQVRTAALLGPGQVAWVHGYECAGAARAARASGAAVLSVVHYLIADESVHSLAAGHDPARRALLPGAVSRVSQLTPTALQRPLVRASSLLSSFARRLPWPPLIQMQLERLAHERALLRASHRVMAVGRHFADTISRHYPEVSDRVRWCFAGGPPARPAVARAFGERRRLLMVGRPTPQKGWDTAAGALHLLEQRHPTLAERLELEVVGGLSGWRGPTTDFGSATLRRLQALGRVHFIDAGRLAHAEVLPRYEAADGFLFPSVYEPFGLVLLEAFAAGCPVIASDADGPADLVTDALGWRVPFAEPALRPQRLMAALVAFLTADASQLSRRSDAARARLADFSWASCASAHLSAMEQVARR